MREWRFFVDLILSLARKAHNKWLLSDAELHPLALLNFRKARRYAYKSVAAEYMGQYKT